MKRIIAIVFLLGFLGLFIAPIATAAAGHREATTLIVWRNTAGQPIYSGEYLLTKCRGKQVLRLVRSWRHGPLAYRCMAPHSVDHPGNIRLRYYLPTPSMCFIPEAYKVCLQPAFVEHGHVNVLPYLYFDNVLGVPCRTALPQFSEPFYYRQAPLEEASVAELGAHYWHIRR